MTSAARILSMILLAFLPLTTEAREPVAFGNYVIHYNAFTSDFLDPQVAQSYGIQRSHNRAVLTIAVQDKSAHNKAVAATITGNAATQNQQVRPLTLREVKEGDSIYYLADFPVSNEEILDFTLNVKPQGAAQPYELRFRQQFFAGEGP